MFCIEYTFKGHVYVFAGRVKIVSHSACRTSAILKYFCPLEKCVVKCTDHPNMTIAVYWDVKLPPPPPKKKTRGADNKSLDWWPSGAFRIKIAYLAGL